MEGLTVWIMLIMVFLCVVFLFMGLAQMFSKEDNLVQNRMKQFTEQQQDSAATQGLSSRRVMEELDVVEEVNKDERKKSDLLKKVGEIITPTKMRENLQADLTRADIPLKAVEFVAITFILTLGFMSLGFFVFKNLIIGFLMGGFGLVLPQLWLKMKHGSKVKRFTHQLLDTLVMMSSGLKAGYSFPQAMDLVAKEAAPPTSTEFQQTLRQAQLGVPMEEALTNLNKRINSEDLDLVITVVLIQRQIGGNLAEILESISAVLRDRMKLKGQIATLTAQGRLSGYLIAAMPFGLGVVLYFMNPEYMMLLFTYRQGAFKGWYLVVAGLMLQAVGFFLIMKITDIDL